MGSFVGMIGSGDWVTNARPYDWLGKLFMQYPNGGMFNNGHIPLTGFSSLIGNVLPASDPYLHWWDKNFAERRLAITANAAVFTGAEMAAGTLYLTTYATNNATVGTRLYIKVAEAFAEQLKEGDVINLLQTLDQRAAMPLLILSASTNGANSVLVCRMLKADTATASYGIGTCDNIEVTGTSFAEGTYAPEGIHYDPTERTSYTQIQKHTVEQTGTAQATEQRIDNDYNRDVLEVGELHAVDLELAALNSRALEFTGTNGKKQRTSMGAFEFINTYSPAANISDYNTASGFAGRSWQQGGGEWLDNWMVDFSVYANETWCLCGNYVMQAVKEIAEYMGWQPLATHQMEFGVTVHTLTTTYMSIHFTAHPLLSVQPAWQRLALMFNPKNVYKRPLRNEAKKIDRDTKFITDRDYDDDVNMFNRPDGKREGWITEAGWSFMLAKQWALLTNFGIDRD